MIPVRLAILASFLCCFAVVSPGQRLFVLPGPGGAVQVLAAEPFAAGSAVSAGPAPTRVFGAPDGSRYYIINRTATDTVVILNSALARVGSLNLGTQVNGEVAAELSPDGTRLVILTDRLHILNATTGTELTALANVGFRPDDVAISPDGLRAYVVSAERLTAFDLANGAPIGQPLALTSGILPNAVAVAPNGLVYVSGPSKLLEVDPLALTVRATIRVDAHPGKLVFNSDATNAIAINRDPQNGGSVLVAFNLTGRTVIGSIPANAGIPFDEIFYGGKIPAAAERWYGYSRTTRRIYEFNLSSLSPIMNSLIQGQGNILGMAISNEQTARYIYYTTASAAYRLDTNQLAFPASVPLTGGSGDPVFVAPATSGAAAEMGVLNRTQSVTGSERIQPLLIRVLDVAGRPAAAIPVSFTAAGLTFAPASSVTNPEGYAYAYPVNPGVAAEHTVEIRAGNLQPVTATITITSAGSGAGGGTTPPPVEPSGAGLYAISGNGQIVAQNAPAAEPLRVQLKDASGNGVPGRPINFTAAAGVSLQAQNSLLSCTANTCTGNTDQAGTAEVLVQVGALPAGTNHQSTAIRVTSETHTRDFTLTVVRQTNLIVRLVRPPQPGATIPVPAGTTATGAIQIQVVDPNLTPVPSIGLRVSAPNGLVQCVGGTVLTDASGLATCDLTAGPQAGEASITAWVGGTYQSFPFNVRVTPVVLPAYRVDISSGTSTALRAIVRDAATGSPVPGVPVTWAPPQGVTLSGATSVSNASGEVAATATLPSAAGSYPVRLTAGATTVTFALRVGPAPAALTVADGNNQNAEIEKPFEKPLTVRLADAAGQPIAGAIVDFAATTGSATLSSSTAQTDQQGRASVTVTAPATAQDIVITASHQGLNATFSLRARPQGPSFGLNNLLNGASLQVQAFVAPCQILTITGTGLASHVQGLAAPTTLMIAPKPTVLSGVQVSVGGTAAPIFHVGTLNGREQVTLQVPCEVIPGTNTSLTVTVQGGSRTLDSVPVRAVAPGIFSSRIAEDWIHAVVTDEQGNYITPENRAPRGRIYRVYATGLGEVDPGTRTGAAGVGEQLPKSRITVGMNAQGVREVRTEYVKGLVGVYLVTFEIPEDMTTGERVPLDIGVIVGDERVLSAGSSIAVQ